MPPHAEWLKDHIRDIPDFPKPGIVFKDISPLLADHTTFTEVVLYIQESANNTSNLVLNNTIKPLIVAFGMVLMFCGLPGLVETP